MKKIISLSLIVFMIFSLITITTSAQTENLLVNGGFEDGNTENWVLNGPACKVEATEEAAHSGKYGVSITNRTGRYSTIAQNIYETYYNNGPGTYQAKVWVKLKEAVDERVKCQLVISYTESGKEMRWITSRILSLTTEWQQFTIETNINISVYDLESLLIYPQVESAASENNYDFYFDDMTFVKVSKVIKPDPNHVDIDVVDNATTENIIENGDFEIDDEEGFLIEGSFTPEFDAEYAHSGEFGMLLTERGHQYSTVRWDIQDAYAEYGPGQYRACVYVRLVNEDDIYKNITCEFALRYSVKGEATRYMSSGRRELSSTRWTKIVFDREINLDPMQVRELSLYPQVVGPSPDIVVEFCVDDATLYKTSPIVEPDPDYEKVEDIKVDTKIPVTPVDISNVDRNPGPTTVGVIRWDAWYGDDGLERSVIAEVQRTLSPAEFHFRAPFFANVTEEGKISIPEYTQEIFDKEMEYAIDAGIDYFIFYWYTDAMQKARQYYKTSKYNDKIKMCIMFGGSSNSAEEHQEVAELLQQGYYMTVLNGRPLMYYDCSPAAAKDDIAYYRRLCKQLGIPEPYVVCTKAKTTEISGIVGDAVGDYAVANGGNISFAELARSAERKWKGYERSGVQYVPIVTTGYNLLPRYKNQVYWMEVPNDQVADYATADEIYEHLTNAFNYMQQPEILDKTKINTVIMYAWNEHDEGGWICPTIKVDENGNQLYDDNGEKLIDTSRIEAVKKAIADFKADYTDPVKSTATTENGGGNTNEGNTSNTLTMMIVGASCGAVVLIGVVITIIVVAKKNKKGAVKDEQ